VLLPVSRLYCTFPLHRVHLGSLVQLFRLCAAAAGFTLLFFIENVCTTCFCLAGHLQTCKLVLLLLPWLFFRMALCYGQAHVQFYDFVGRNCLLFRCVVVLDVFVCCIRFSLLKTWRGSLPRIKLAGTWRWRHFNLVSNLRKIET
jgi:hypothetical protein